MYNENAPSYTYTVLHCIQAVRQVSATTNIDALVLRCKLVEIKYIFKAFKLEYIRFYSEGEIIFFPVIRRLNSNLLLSAYDSLRKLSYILLIEEKCLDSNVNLFNVIII